MATVPVLDPSETRAIGQDTPTLQFERLELVRVRLAARRRHRWIVAAKLVIALVSIGVLIFAAIRRTSFERLGSPPSSAPAETLTPLAASPAAASPAATDFAIDPPPVIVPPSASVDSVKRDAPHARRRQARADQRRRPSPGKHGEGAAPRARGEAQGVEAAVPTAAIDWLLKNSPTTSPIGGSAAVLSAKEEIRR